MRMSTVRVEIGGRAVGLTRPGGLILGGECRQRGRVEVQVRRPDRGKPGDHPERRRVRR